MTRISELALQQILLQGFQRNQESAIDNQIRLSTGDRFQSYAGYGADTLRLLSSEGVVTRATAYEGAANVAQTRLDAQETTITTIMNAVGSIREAFVAALSTGASEQLTPQIESATQQILTAANTKIGGTYIFGGTDGSRPPVDARSISDLTAAGDVADLFSEGAPLQLAVAEGQQISGGPVASDIVGELLGGLQGLSQNLSALGPLDGTLTAPQRDEILMRAETFGAIEADLVQTLGVLGVSQFQASEAVSSNRSQRDYAEVVASEIEDADIAEVVARLNQDQLAIQAAAQALSQASELSLLNFI